jgi:alpha-beta hydrolase superfamily lysophospholipase
VNYFELFQLPAQFELDSHQLAETYRQLQQQFHPDRVASAPVNERLLAMQQAYRHAHQLTTPLLLLSASDDQVVSNAHIAAFCARAAAAGVPCNPQPLTIAGARHELLNERDECRIPALTAILDFFERNQ